MSTLETSHTAPARPWPLTRTAGIAGIGAALPERRVPNAEIAARLGVDEDWIERRTGISGRRYAAPAQRVSELATSAARAALQSARLDASETRAIVERRRTILGSLAAAAWIRVATCA